MSALVAFEIVRGSSVDHDLPRKFELTPSPSSTFFLFAMLIPALVAAIIVPYFLSAYLAASAQNFASFIINHPLTTIELLMATVLLSGLFFYLLAEFLIRLGRRRTVWLDKEGVSIREKSLFGTRAWWLPISEFDGLTHYVRSTFSDQHHELVLVHPEAGSSILLHVGQEQPGALMAKYCAKLDLPEIHARHVHKRDGGVFAALLPATLSSKPA